MTAEPPAIGIENIVKSFGATKALNEANFRVHAGSVHALLGENGAGKSTMIKLLSGTIQPDSGTIRVYGEAITMRGPRDAHRHGLQTAFQELTLVPDLSVLQNMMVPNQPTGFAWQLRHREARRAVDEFFESVGLGTIDPRKEARAYSLNIRQKIEIARAIFRKPRILFLDEATSTMSGDDIDWLDGLIGRLKADGVTIIFITHRMAEVRRFCDEVTVLRNGRDVGTFRSADIEDQKLIELIVGRSLSTTFPARPDKPVGGTSVLSVANLATAERLHDCSFDLRAGEILGVAGLQGMGQRELFLALFGAEPVARGMVTLSGEPIRLGSPQHAIDLGIGLVPEERKTEGLFLKLSGRENVLMPVLGRFARGGIIDGRAATAAAAEVMQRVQVDKRALYTPAGAFSGGNQQKIALAKWLVTQTRVLLLFDPSRGVDVGTKREIYLLMRAYVDAGGALLFYSTEIPELANLCDRVMVMYRGRVAGEIARERDPIDERSIVEAALGLATLPAPVAPPASPAAAPLRRPA